MRRFENEGRFWEITIDGASVTTRSGSGNGKGRTSTTRCNSAPAAAAELTERVSKKMCEPGWVEVLPPFLGPVDLSPRIDGLDPAEIARWQRAPGTLAIDGPTAARAVTQAVGMARDRLVAGLKAGLGDPSAREALVRVLTKGPAFIRNDAVHITVLLAVSPAAETMDLIVGRFGVASAVAALSEGPRWVVRRDLRTAHLELGEGKIPLIRPAVARLRELLLRAEDDAHRAAVARIAAGLEGSAERVLELLSLVPGAKPLHRELRREGIEGPMIQLLRFANSTEFVAAVRGARSLPSAKLMAPLESVLEREGVDGVPALYAVADRAGGEGMALLARARLPQTVERLLALLDHPTLGDPARAAAIAMGDLTLATLARQPPTQAAAIALATWLARQPGLADALAPHLEPDAAQRIHGWRGLADALPDVVSAPPALASDGAVKLPRWVPLATLPLLAPPDGVGAYPPAATATLLSRLEALFSSSSAPDRAQLSALADACSTASVDRVLADVLRAYAANEVDPIYKTSPWSRAGERDEEHGWVGGRWVRDPRAPDVLRTPWIVAAVGALGDDLCSEALFRNILDWGRKRGRYPELLSQAVEAQCALPGEENLVRLGALARRVKSTKVRIDLHLSRLARERGVDPAHLGEALLPTLGLDPRGRTVLDYGPRQFEVGFDATLSPWLAAKGVRIRSLPKPSATDDPAAAKAAQTRWKDLKAQVRTLRTTLMRQLEDGLREQRTWRPEPFTSRFAKHSLARHPVQALLWCSGDTFFRVDETGEPVDADDRPVDLSAPVRLAHPLTLSIAERDAWAQVFEDYQLLQPFPQLARETFAEVSVGALKGQSISRPHLFGLKSRGWLWQVSSTVRGEDYEEAMLYGLSLALQGVRVTLSTRSPVAVSGDEPLTIGGVELFVGSWDEVPAIARSEIGRDLQMAVS